MSERTDDLMVYMLLHKPEFCPIFKQVDYTKSIFHFKFFLESLNEIHLLYWKTRNQTGLTFEEYLEKHCPKE